jgi:hypothetical protein
MLVACRVEDSNKITMRVDFVHAGKVRTIRQQRPNISLQNRLYSESCGFMSNIGT